jgi:hypothetical protein
MPSRSADSGTANEEAAVLKPLPVVIVAPAPEESPSESSESSAVDAETVACWMCATANGARQQSCGACGAMLRAAPASWSVTRTAVAACELATAEVPCPECATPNATHLRYCQSCGFLLKKAAGPAPVTPEAKPEPEPLCVETPMSTVVDLGDEPKDRTDHVDADAPPRVRGGWRRRVAVGVPLVAAIAGASVLALSGRSKSIGTADAGSRSLSASPAQPAAGATKPEIPSAMGLLITSNAPRGHRVFVNGHPVGQTPQVILVECGSTRVKIGRSGQERVVDVPCGQEIDVSKP